MIRESILAGEKWTCFLSLIGRGTWNNCFIISCLTDGGVSVGVKGSEAPLMCDTQLLVRSHYNTDFKNVKSAVTMFPTRAPTQFVFEQFYIWKLTRHQHPSWKNHTYLSFRNLQISSQLKFNMTAPLDRIWLWNCKIFWYVGIHFTFMPTVQEFGSMKSYWPSMFPCRESVEKSLFYFMRWTSMAVPRITSCQTPTS